MTGKRTQNMLKVIVAATMATIAILSCYMNPEWFVWGRGFSDYDFETAKSELETELPIRFPKEIVEGRAGKRTATHAIDYIVRFSAKPELVDEFLDSFPEGYKRVPYTTSKDSRLRASIFPKWFKARISKGYEITDHFIWAGQEGTVTDIYIDTYNPDEHIVYIVAILPRKQANTSIL